MTRNCFITFTVLAVAAIATAAAVVSPVSTGTDVTGTVTTKELVIFSPPKNITSQALGQTSTALSILPEPDIGPLGAILWAAVIAGGFQFSASVCGATVTVGGPAGAAVCAVALAGTLLASAFAIYKVGNAKRSTTVDWYMDVDPAYAPTISCGITCQLETRSPHNKWTLFGNVTTNGIAHTVSFFQNGNIKGIRAVQLGTKLPAVTKRQDIIITEEVVVGDSATGTADWIGTIWDNWSADEDQASTFLGEYMVDNEVEIACFDVSDDSGGGLGSIFLLDDIDEELLYASDTTMEAVLNDCIDIMPAADQKRRLKRGGDVESI
ncbi:hypothetical protein B7463_g11517, partial [Scytalidium lignicola]